MKSTTKSNAYFLSHVLRWKIPKINTKDMSLILMDTRWWKSKTFLTAITQLILPKQMGGQLIIT